MKIVVLDGYTLNPGDLDWSDLESLGNVDNHQWTEPDQETITNRMRDAAIVLTNKTPITKETIDNSPALRYIGVLATGYNVVDVEAAAGRSIPVTNIPIYGTDSVAQMAFAHILDFCHRVSIHSSDVKAGGWSNCRDFCYWKSPLIELTGKAIGIIGFGRIGRRVGELATAFGMRVLAHDIYQNNPPPWDGFSWSGIEELIVESDIVTLHCPLTADNKGLINAERLAKMKATALFLNMSRGPLVVDADLARALEDGTIAGAGIDVLEQEPPAPGNPLFSAPNITITPHIAWATREARSRLLNTAVDNIRAFLAGSPENVVNGA